MGKYGQFPVRLSLTVVLLFYLEISDTLPIEDSSNVKEGDFAQNSGESITHTEDHTENIQEDDRVDQVFAVQENYTDTNKYLVIDDMIIRKTPSRAGLVNNVWPNGIMPYSYAVTILPQQKSMILQALAEISTRTCIQFRPARKDDNYWVTFQNDPMNQGCSSFIGWQNMRSQPIQLSTICSTGNAVHEVMHALGFFHEHTRNDRDEYIKVQFENIEPGMTRNFVKEQDMDPPPESTTYDIPYNYNSIMHYGKDFFSKNQKPTIEALNNPAATGNGDKIGQREYVSSGDAALINKKYNCPVMPNPGDETPISTNPSNPMCQMTPMMPLCKQNELEQKPNNS